MTRIVSEYGDGKYNDQSNLPLGDKMKTKIIIERFKAMKFPIKLEKTKGQVDGLVMTDSIESDLDFLIEIQEKINDGLERNDPERIKYALKMVSDWIDEIQSA